MILNYLSILLIFSIKNLNLKTLLLMMNSDNDTDSEKSDRELLFEVREKLDRHEAKRRNKNIRDNIFWILILGAFIGLIAVIIWVFRLRSG